MAGWWWSPAPQEPKSDLAKLHTPQDVPAAPNTSTPAPTTAQPTSSQTPEPSRKRFAGSQSGEARLDQLNRDEERALEEFREAFSTEYHKSKSSASTDASSGGTKEPAYDEELYPTYLSCSACFDSAYYCSSVGGQLNNIYRYGALRSCSELWAQWRFCMRTKTMGEEEKKRRIWEWNREKEARRKIGRNSEEVWGVKARELSEAGRKHNES